MLTLLSPPDTARMLPVMDQLTCHTTSLNLCSSLAVHVLPAGSSHVQMNTRPSCRAHWTRRRRRRNQRSAPEPNCLTACRLPLPAKVLPLVGDISFIPLPYEEVQSNPQIKYVKKLIIKISPHLSPRVKKNKFTKPIKKTR